MAIDWDAKVGTPTTKIFGVDGGAKFKPAAGGSFDIIGVFDEGYRETVVIDNVAQTTDATPVLGVPLSQFAALGAPAPAQDDVIIVKAEQFLIKEVRPDSHGHAKLMLAFQGPAP